MNALVLGSTFLLLKRTQVFSDWFLFASEYQVVIQFHFNLMIPSSHVETDFFSGKKCLSWLLSIELPCLHLSLQNKKMKLWYGLMLQ